MSVAYAFFGAVGALVFLGLLYVGIRNAYEQGLRRPPGDPPYPGCVFWASGPLVAFGLIPYVGWWCLAAPPALHLFTMGALAVAASFGRGRGACLRHAKSADARLSGFGAGKLIRFHDAEGDPEIRVALEEQRRRVSGTP